VTVVLPGFWNGFEWKIVVITYSVLIFITLLMLLIGKIRQSKGNSDDSAKSKGDFVYMNPKSEEIE